MENQTEFSKRLEKISKVFDIQKVLSVKINQDYIRRYYKVNKIPYSLFHTNSDLIYMGISKDGKYKEDDLLEAARTVERYIKKLNGNNVLELATGRGASSFYLAKKFPTIQFYGMDVSKGQLDYAFKKAKKVNNYRPSFGDYNDLKRFGNGTFDIVFVIEALCYSQNKEKVLAEVYRILKKGGVFIIFDGYSTEDRNKLADSERMALELTEKGMALEEFESYNSFIAKIKKTKFKKEFEENVSEFTLPTMERFERISKIFFKFQILAKFVTLFLPKEFLYNTLSGYLSPLLIKNDVCRYMITIIKK